MATFMSSATLPNNFRPDFPVFPSEDKKPLKCYPNNPLLRHSDTKPEKLLKNSDETLI